MSKANKIQFKAELELDLKSPEDIQKWALDILEKDPSDELALDICFLSTSEQVLDYFKKISKESFDIYLKNKVIDNLLNDYVLKKVSNVTTQYDIYPFFQDILFLSKYLNNEDLNALIDFYDDVFFFSLEGYSQSEPMNVFQNLISDLLEWQKHLHLT